MINDAVCSGSASIIGSKEESNSNTDQGRIIMDKMNVFLITRFETPLGTMVAGDYKGSLCLLEFADRRVLEREIADLERLFGAVSQPGRTAFHEKVEQQIAEYFCCKRQIFDLSLNLPGPDFTRSVWAALIQIPYGATRSYRDQAAAIGKPSAIRAVARANGANRVSIVVPCHRVIGVDGALTGYGGGLYRKRALLDLESGRQKF